MSDWSAILHILVAPFSHILVERYLGESKYVQEKTIKLKVSALLNEDHDVRAAENIFSLIAALCVKNLDTALKNFLRSEVKDSDPKTQQALVEFVAGALKDFIEQRRLSAKLFLDGNLQEAEIWNRLNGSSFDSSGRKIQQENRIEEFSRAHADFSETERAIFSFALRSTISLITEAFLTVAPLEQEASLWKIRKLNQIGEQLDSLSERLQYVENISAKSNALLGYEIERFYRREISRATNSLQLLGIDVDQSFRTLPLDSAYVSLSLSSSANGSVTSRASLLDCLEICAERSTDLLLVGDAGTGKTTLTRYLTFSLAGGKGTLFDRRSGEDSKAKRLTDLFLLPFLVSLREVREFPLTLGALITQFVSMDADVEYWLRKRIEGEGVIAIFDGLDEISEEKRTETIKFVRSLKERFPKVVIVITTRPLTVKKLGLHEGDFNTANINPLSGTEQLRLVDYWFGAMTRSVMLAKPQYEIAIHLRQQLKSMLNTSRALSNIAVSPLLCSCICALWYHHNGHIPSSYKEISDALVRMLLDNRDRDRGLKTDQLSENYAKLTSSQKRFIAKTIAYYMIRNDLSQVEQEWLLSTLSKSAGWFLGAGLDEDLFGVFVERCGLLRETRPGQLEFIHNTFKEYLGAECAADEGDVGFVVGKSSEPEWMQFVAFAAASENVKFADKVLEFLLAKIAEADEGTRRTVATSFLKAVGSAVRIPHALSKAVNDVKFMIIPPRSQFEAESLATAGDEICEFLAYKERTIEESIFCIKTLALNGSVKAIKTLMGYVDDGRPAVCNELVMHINPLHIPKYGSAFVKGHSLSDHVRSLIADLSPIMDKTDVVTIMNLSGSYISDLSEIHHFKNLEKLDLSRTPVVNIGPLGELENLEILDLSFTPVRNAKPLEKLKCLVELYLDYSECEELFDILDLPRLRVLSLKRTAIGDYTFPPKGSNLTVHVD